MNARERCGRPQNRRIPIAIARRRSPKILASAGRRRGTSASRRRRSAKTGGYPPLRPFEHEPAPGSRQEGQIVARHRVARKSLEKRAKRRGPPPFALMMEDHDSLRSPPQIRLDGPRARPWDHRTPDCALGSRRGSFRLSARGQTGGSRRRLDSDARRSPARPRSLAGSGETGRSDRNVADDREGLGASRRGIDGARRATGGARRAAGHRRRIRGGAAAGGFNRNGRPVGSV